MGNYINKLFSHNETEIEREEIRNASSLEQEATDTMQTPLQFRRTFADPRSITSGISRTPIEANDTSVEESEKISAISEAKPYLETDLDKILLCLSPKKSHVPERIRSTRLLFSDEEEEKIKTFLTPSVHNLDKTREMTDIEIDRYNILGIDPRSPAADFTRTPLLNPISLKRLRARSQECLHKYGSYDDDSSPRYSYCETTSQFGITEVEALPDIALRRIKSLNLVNLNESDLPCSGHSAGIKFTSEYGENEIEDQNKIQTSEQDNSDDLYVTENLDQEEACTNDNCTIKVWKDLLVSDESQESKTNELNDVQSAEERVLPEFVQEFEHRPNEEVVITIDNDSISNNMLSLKMAKSDITKVRTIGEKKKIIKYEAQIAVDQRKVFNDINGDEPVKVRIPLGNRSNTQRQVQASTNSPKQKLRNKGMTSRMLQENTPPHKKYVAKSKLSGTQWDPDSTIVI